MKSDRCETTDKKKSTHAQAKKEAKYLRRKKPLRNLIAQAYYCHDCGWWHVGNA